MALVAGIKGVHILVDSELQGRRPGSFPQMIVESVMRKTRAKIPGLLCLMVLVGILVAGLWPFRRPLNGVTWLKNENGLRLAEHATLWSIGSFKRTEQDGQEPRTLELWVQPGIAKASGPILSFSTPEDPLRFSASQYHSLFMVRRDVQDGQHHRTATIGIDGVFRPAVPVFITVTSGQQETAMYVDGELNRTFRGTRIDKDYHWSSWLLVPSPVDDIVLVRPGARARNLWAGTNCRTSSQALPDLDHTGAPRIV